MDTRLDECEMELGGDTWIDEVTLPDFDLTTLDGAPSAAPGDPQRRSLSAFHWR